MTAHVQAGHVTKRGNGQSVEGQRVSAGESLGDTLEVMGEGRGVVLLLSCFFQAGLVFGALRSFGIFFPELVEYFGSAAASVSWVTSGAVAVQQLMSPLGCALALRFGTRPVVMLGGLLSALGMFCASFSSTLPHLYLSIGGLSGLGWAFIFSPSMAAVTSCFSARRSLATGFVLTGVGIFSFALTPLLQYLVEEFSWQGAMLLLSGVALHSVPCGALLHPERTNPPAPQRSFLWGWELLCDWPFLRYSAAVTLINAAYFVPFTHLYAHMREHGAGERQAALLMALVGIADVAGRVFAGWLSDLSPKRTLLLLSLWTALTAATLGLLPLAGSTAGMGAATIALGFCSGALTPGVFSGLPWVVGTERVLPALGLLQMLESAGALLGPPISGRLRDWSGAYSLSFFLSGSFLLLGSLIILTLPGVRCHCWIDQSEAATQSDSGITNKESSIVTNGRKWEGPPLSSQYGGGAAPPPYITTVSASDDSAQHTELPPAQGILGNVTTVDSSLTAVTVPEAVLPTAPLLEGRSSAPCTVTSLNLSNAVL